MPAPRILLSLLLSVFVFSGSVPAQEAYSPRISVVHPGPENLKLDLKSLFDLTSPEEQKSWIDLEDILVITSSGVDPSRPVRMDVLTGLTPINYLIWLPFADDDGLFELRDNLDAGLGFLTIPEPGSSDLYKIESLDNDLDEGWFRVLPKQRYALLILTTPETRVLLKQVVLKSGDPLPDVEGLVKPGAGAAAEIANALQDAGSLEKRRDSLREIRAVELDSLQRRPDEMVTAFELRRESYSFVLDELERVLAEADDIRIWGDLDRNEHKSTLRFDGKAIPQTSLAKSISEFGSHPDMFATTSPLPETVFSGRLNHPLDEMRRTNLNRFLDLMQTDIEARIAASEKLEPAEKAATSRLTAEVISLVRDGAATGYINGFAEASHDAGEFTMVGGVSVPDAGRLTAALDQIPLARNGNTVDLGVATVDEVTIHKIQLAEGFVRWVDRIFGKRHEFFVGIGKDKIWMATGPGSLDAMKSRISELGDPAASDMALRLDVKLHPWVQRFYELAQEEEEPTGLEERRAWREDLVMMKQAVESLAKYDELHFELSVSDQVISGAAALNSGLMRFVGRRLARFSKENLGVD